jgi:hypothetical protein
MIWPLLTDERSRKGVVIAELFADGLVGESELALAYNEALAGHGIAAPAVWATRGPWEDWVSLATCVRSAAGYAAQAFGGTREGKLTQLALLHDVFGNPFQPLPPRTCPAHVKGLAQSCYEAFPAVSRTDYDVLADALTDLGEDRAAAHCREPLHTKGCHVLDWTLGKQ